MSNEECAPKKIEEESNGEKVYICFSTDFRCLWYVLDPKTGESSQHCAMNNNDADSAPPHTHLYSGCAVVGSDIYVAGGQLWDPDASLRRTTNSVCVFSTVSDKWNDPPHDGMLFPRSNPLLVHSPQLNRLYAFGGGIQGDSWGECLDLLTHHWFPLIDPPESVLKSRFMSGHAILGGGQFLLWNSQLFCIYDTYLDSWTHIRPVDRCFLPQVNGHCFNGISTTVCQSQTYVFWFCAADLFSYDLARLVPSMDTLCHLECSAQRPPISGFHSLIFLNKWNLALMWYDDDLKQCVWRTFELRRYLGNGPLSAVPVNIGRFGVDGIRLCHTLVVPQTVHGEKEKFQDPRSLMRDLCHTMYMKNYLTSSQNFDDKDQQTAERYEVETLVHTLLHPLGLDEYWEHLLGLAINRNVMKDLTEEDLMLFNIQPKNRTVSCISGKEADSDYENSDYENSSPEVAIDSTKPLEMQLELMNLLEDQEKMQRDLKAGLQDLLRYYQKKASSRNGGETGNKRNGPDDESHSRVSA